MEVGSTNGQFHCHSTNHLNRYNLHRQSTTFEENNSTSERMRYNTLRLPSTSHTKFSQHTSNPNGHGNIHTYATVQVRQRHTRASILPPGVVSCNGKYVDRYGGKIRRFASVQLRPKTGVSHKGRNSF